MIDLYQIGIQNALATIQRAEKPEETAKILAARFKDLIKNDPYSHGLYDAATQALDELKKKEKS